MSMNAEIAIIGAGIGFLTEGIGALGVCAYTGAANINTVIENTTV